MKNWIERYATDPDKGNSSKRDRAYKHEKTPPTPRAPPKSRNKKIKAKVLETGPHIEHFCCSTNQRYPFGNLQKKQLKTLNAKERLIAARKLKNLSHEMQQWIYAQIHQKCTVPSEEKVALTLMIERHEERHFQLDRIIKYLSGP